MFYAIETRYAGPTDHRGARIVATWQDCRHVMAYRHELDESSNHRRAALELCLEANLLHDGEGLRSGRTRAGAVHVIGRSE